MSDTPRTDAEWNTYEPQCADASQLAELMYQWACAMERELHDSNLLVSELKKELKYWKEHNHRLGRGGL